MIWAILMKIINKNFINLLIINYFFYINQIFNFLTNLFLF